MPFLLKATIEQLKQKQISSVELTQMALENINKNKPLNAFIHVDEDFAVQQAKEADKLLASSQGGSLCGVPMAHKDLFCTQHMPTTCGSKMLANFNSPYDATIVSKLSHAGAIMIGKTNMDEFAMGSGNETSYFGAVKNPWDPTRVAGGSSGGSACAVAADVVPFTTGSDTGGSIRLPASFCGISGLKPTYGLVSRFGMTAHASSLDQAGPMARTAEDLALVLQEMAGFDKKDSTSVSHRIPDYNAAIHKPMKKIRIGLAKAFFDSKADANVLQAVMQAAQFFEKNGAQLVDIDLPLQPMWIPCYYVIACAEASSNLSRFDGVRYGHRSKKAHSISELIANSRQEGFGLEVKRRIFTGAHVLSSGFFDAYFIKAMQVRRLIQQEFVKVLSEVDIILGPTSPTCAFQLGQNDNDPIRNYLADTFTVAANLAGLPALSIPVGFARQLPIGMQLIGNAFTEDLLLNIAHHYQQHSDWHLASANQ